jgi:ABC-type nitrate/sulfonate/bicarbonate transport system permease component
MELLMKTLSSLGFDRSWPKGWKYLLISAFSLLIFLGIWQLVSAWYHGRWPFEWRPWVVTSEYIPYPGGVIMTFLDSFVTPDPITGLLMTDHIVASLRRIFLAFILAFAAAVPLGLLMGRSTVAESASKPIVEVFRPIPPLAWVPVFLLLFGFFWGPILIVFLGIFFPLLLNMRLGAKSVDPVLIDAARTLGAGRVQIFAKVVLPYTIPYMMTGVTVGLGIGWMCIVAAEILGGVGGGVGYYIFSTAGVHRYDLMYAGMVAVGMLSVLTTGVAGIIERRVYKWMGMK